MTSQSKQPQQHDQPALRSKVVIRGAPPTLPEDILWTSLEPVVKLDTDIDWRSFQQGRSKVIGNQTKESVDSVAYLHFKRPEQIIGFAQAYNGHVFRDKQGKQTQVTVAYAPFQKIPIKRQRPDPLAGTIEEDPIYKAFVASLTEPEAKPPLDVIPAIPKAVNKSTPLLDALRQQKQAAAEAQAERKREAKKSANKKTETPVEPTKASNKKVAPSLVTTGKPESSVPLLGQVGQSKHVPSDPSNTATRPLPLQTSTTPASPAAGKELPPAGKGKGKSKATKSHSGPASQGVLTGDTQVVVAPRNDAIPAKQKPPKQANSTAATASVSGSTNNTNSGNAEIKSAGTAAHSSQPRKPVDPFASFINSAAKQMMTTGKTVAVEKPNPAKTTASSTSENTKPAQGSAATSALVSPASATLQIGQSSRGKAGRGGSSLARGGTRAVSSAQKNAPPDSSAQSTIPASPMHPMTAESARGGRGGIALRGRGRGRGGPPFREGQADPPQNIPPAT